MRIEEECLKILAMHQPVATDLRRITSVFKISNELERVADLAVHIAERACGLVTWPEVYAPANLKEMAAIAGEMLRNSIDAYVDLDTGLARRVCARDEEVDRLNREIIGEILTRMKETPAHVEPLLAPLSASRHVERVADHATNIAEDVVYLVEGRSSATVPRSDCRFSTGSPRRRAAAWEKTSRPPSGETSLQPRANFV